MTTLSKFNRAAGLKFTKDHIDSCLQCLKGKHPGACAGCRASAADSMLFSGVLEGRGSEVAKWLQSPAFESQLFSFFPCSDPPSPVASPMRVGHSPLPKCHRAVCGHMLQETV